MGLLFFGVAVVALGTDHGGIALLAVVCMTLVD